MLHPKQRQSNILFLRFFLFFGILPGAYLPAQVPAPAPSLSEFWLHRLPDWPYQYDWLQPVDTSSAIIFVNHRAGVIDISGREKIVAQYDQVQIGSLWPWFPFFYAYYDNHEGLFDTAGRQIIPVRFTSIRLMENEFQGTDEHSIIRYSLKGVAFDSFPNWPPDPQNIRRRAQSDTIRWKWYATNRLDRAYRISQDGARRRIVDKSGNIVLPDRYEYVEDLLYRGKMSGFDVMDDEWNYYISFNTPVFAAGKKDSLGLFDGKGWLTKQIYTNFHRLTDQFIAFRKDSTFILDTCGVQLYALPLPAAECQYNQWIYSNGNRDSVWSLGYGWVTGMSNRFMEDCSDRYFAFRKNNGLISVAGRSGRLLVDSCEKIIVSNRGFRSDKIGLHSLIYKKNGLLGWTLLDGTHTEAAQYDDILYLSRNYFLAQKNQHWGLLDGHGRVVLPFRFEDVQVQYYQDVVFLKQDGFWRAFYPDGKPFCREVFQEAKIDYSGIVYGRIAEGWRLYDPQGKSVFPTAVDHVAAMSAPSSAIVQKNGKFAQFTLHGRQIRNFEWDSLVYTYYLDWGKKGDSVTIFHANGWPEGHPSITVKGTTVRDMQHLGFAVFREGKWSVYNAQTAPLTPDRYDEVQAVQDDTPIILAQPAPRKWEILDQNGKILQKVTADSLRAYLPGFVKIIRGNTRKILNIKSGEIFRKRFDPISRLSANLYLVGRKGKMGMVDERLHEIIACRYDQINPGEHDLFKVSLGKKFGYLDHKGEVCIPLDNYDPYYYGRISENILAVKKDGRIGLYSIDQRKWISTDMSDIQSCEIRLPLTEKLFLIRVNGLFGLMDENCRRVLDPVYTNITAEEKFIRLSLSKGCIVWDPVAREPITPICDQIRLFGNKSLCRQGNVFTMYENKKQLWTKNAEDISWLMPGLLRLKDLTTHKTGVLNLEGQQLVDPVYQSIDGASTSLLANNDGHTGLLDFQGHVLQPFEYNGFQILENGFLILYKGNKCGLFNEKGKEVMPVEFEKIKSEPPQQIVIGQRGGATKYYDFQGRPLSIGIWEDAAFFYYGCAAVKKGGLWGYINLQGEPVIPLQYRYAGNFAKDPFSHQGYTKPCATILAGSYYQTIDQHGEIVSDGISDYLGDIVRDAEDRMYRNDSVSCQGIFVKMTNAEGGGYIAAQSLKTGKTGLINTLFEWSLQPVYDDIKFLINRQKALAFVRTGKYWGLLGQRMEVLMPLKFESLEETNKPNLFKATLAGRVMMVDEKGEEIRKE